MLSSSTLSTKGNLVNRVTFSYDIIYQQNKNLLPHFASCPQKFVNANICAYDLQFSIHKFHLLDHGKLCQINHSFNVLKGLCRTSGEGIEQG